MAFNFRSVCRQISAVKWVKVSAAVSAIAGWPPSASSAMLKDHESGWVGQKAINNMLRPQNQQMQRRWANKHKYTKDTPHSRKAHIRRVGRAASKTTPNQTVVMFTQTHTQMLS